ncbi:type VI secretion system contractile sheath large subunit [Paracoccaceae bacterium GXU_MW_L88]
MSASAVFAGAANPEEEAERAAFRALAARIDRIIAALDDALTAQLNAILHAPAFRAMEARWLGLKKLVDQAGVGRGVLIRVLNVDWRSLGRNLERSADYDQSRLFRLVYDGEFGMPGGLPFGLLVGDYEVSPHDPPQAQDQVDTLRRLAAVAAAAFCPVILNAGPQTFGYGSFDAITGASDLAPDRSAAMQRLRWDNLRNADDTRFLGLVAPGLVIRAPRVRYMPGRIDGFTFDEAQDRPLVIGGAFAFAATVIAAFQQSGWFADIRGVHQDEQGAGLVPFYPPYDYHTDRHGLSAQSPAAFRPTTTQEEAMIAQGIIPLCSLYQSAVPVFNANPSFHAPATYETPLANQNARLASMLQYVLCTARFAHYLKVIMRDEIGSITDPALIEARLTDWLRSYCLGNDDAAQELKAQYPLRDAGVRIAGIRGLPGSYRCTIHLQPHFQLDDISTSFHLIAEAPQQRSEAAAQPQRSPA